MISWNARSLLALGSLFSLIFTCFLVPRARAQSNVQGQWQTLVTLSPINPIHIALMHNGKVLIVSGSGNDPTVTYFQGGVWDPLTDTATTQPVGWDMFCNGMIVLPDGRPFIMGGTFNYNPFEGMKNTSAYDPVTGNFVDLHMMAHGRWYPTGTVLGDGRVMVFSGLTETATTNNAVEFYTVGSGWSSQSTAPWTPPLYPRMHVLPNGKVFYSGSTTPSWTFDPSALTWTTGPSTNYGNTRVYGTSVLFPLMPANNYAPKVMIMGGGANATATTEIIDLSVANPKWVNGPSMVQPRIEMNATILPNGKILTSGGSSVDEDGTTASLKAEIYDPVSNTFSSAGSNVYPRLYHSNTILLPDATVLQVGSNPTRGTYEQHMELYSPPYLFNSNGSLATRPTITSVTPGVIGYGSAFQVQTPDAANITSAVLIRAGAVTHAFDMDQRLIGLNFTVGSGVLNVTAPPNGNIAPPGYYLLFILNSSGVPSVAQFVQLSLTPTDLPPVATINSPSSNVSVAVGQSVSFSGSGTSPNGTISAYSWVFPGGSPATSTSANPGSVTYSTAGTYVASLTVTDNLGLTSPSPATVAVTVTSGFGLSASPSSQSVSPGNSTTYTVTVTPATGFTGSVGFSTSGLPSGASASFSPKTVTTSGSTTMTVTTSGTTPTGNYTVTVKGTGGSVSASTTVSFNVIATVDTIPPTAPTNLSATAVSSSQVNLSWTAATDDVAVTGYMVERCQGSACANFAQVAVLSTVTIFNDSGLTPSTSYSYRVRATDAAGNLGPYSNIATANTQPPPPPPIKIVQQIATSVSSGALTLSQSFTGPSVTGDLIVVCVKWGDQTISVASIGDDRGNAYTSAVGPTNWSGTAKRAQIFYAKNIIGGGAPITITVTLTAPSTSSFHLYQLEYSNADTVAPLDATAAAIGTATSVSSGPATTKFPNELMLGFSIADSVGVNPGPGFTAEVTYKVNLVEDEMVNAVGSYSATGVATGVSNWFMQMATFKTAPLNTTPPTAPSNLTALATGPIQVNLSWTASTDNVGVTGYFVQRCATSGCTNFAQIASLPGTATTYSDTSVSPSTTYVYQIVATDAAGNLSQPSNAASVTTPADTQAPTAPSNLTATVASNTQINLSWTASTDNVGVTGYLIQRCQGTGCTTFTQVGTTSGTVTTYSDSSLTPSTSYTYQVVATDAAGNLSLPSNTFTAITTGPPAAPSALMATAFSATQINLSWTNNAINQTGFKIERSPDGTTFAQIGTAGASSTNYSDPNLSPLTTYYYRVRATNGSGDSVYSNVANATTLADTTPPTAPTNLGATAASASQINLSWTASTDNVGVTGYKILRCQGAGCVNFAQIAAPAGTGTTFSDTGLSPSTSYSYEVIATDAAGNLSSPSNAATAVTLAGPPAAPTGLTATAASATQINLSWTNNANNQTGFKVERSPNNVNFTQIGTTGAAVTTYSDSSLTPQTTYYYRVRATNGAGDSGYSNVANATTLADTTPPTAPTNLGATAASASQNNLSWTASTDNVGVTGYKIQRCQGAGCTTFAQVAAPAGTGTTFSDTGLLPSTSYSYEVIATDAAGNLSSPSNVATAVTLAGPPAAPTGLTATAASATQINLSWTNNANNQTGFKIERSPDGTTFTQIGTTGAAVTVYSDSPLTPQTTYYYRVRATNGSGDSAYSNVANATTLADTTPPTAPTNLGATAASASQINLSWTASTDNVGVTGYKIQRCQGAGCTTFAQVAAPAGTGTTFSDTGLLPSTSYSDEVIATDAAGNLSSPSNVATAVTLAGPPAAPTGLTATAASATQINLSWTNNANNQTGFKIERSPDGTTFTQIGTTGAAVTVYSDSPLTPLTTYYYRVRATNGTGDSGYSNVASAATLADTTPPTTPTNLTATPFNSTQINLSWTASTDNVGVTQYQIQRCQGSGCTTFAQVGTSVSPSYSDTGLLAATSYSYQVRALDAAGNASGFSNVATAMTPSAALPPVTLVQQAETSVLSGTNTISQSFPAASVSGDLIIVSLKWGNQAVTVSSITDNNGNAYISAVGPTNWDTTLKRAQTFYAKNITAGATPITITVTLSGNSTSSFHIYQFEYTNVDPTSPVDVASASIGLGTAMSCGPVTTNFAGELLYAVAFNDSAVTSAGAGFTALTTYHSNVVEQEQVSAAGSYSATATNNVSSYWYMQLLAIKRHP